MAEFENLQQSIRQARAEGQNAQREAAAKHEKARSLELQVRAVSRSNSPRSEAVQSAVAAHETAVRDSLTARKERDAQQARYADLLVQFERFTDPREQIGSLPDSSPCLLFPVRLETRFKQIQRGRALQHELWVRIFPDQCSIDTFDDLLSASEVARVQSYWAGLWAAGKPTTADLQAQVRDKQLGAWRKLMGSFNAGRAHWLTTQYAPSNPDEAPLRNAATDLLPIIVCVGAAPATKDAICTYWQSVIVAGGAPADVAAALTALKAATGLGDEDARALVAQYSPVDVSTLLEAGAPAGEVRVTFLCFAAGADTKQSAWAHSAKVRSFPERFVLLGYQNNAEAPVVSALGAVVPNPLIVGPDTQEEVQTLLYEKLGQAAVDAMSDEQKAAEYVKYLTQQSETSWLFDFERAVSVGLGFRVPLSPQQYAQGFSRLLVLGLQLSSDAQAGKAALEELLRHHQLGDAGFSILRQGTPTNNTEDSAAGFSIHEDPEEAFDRYSGEQPPDLDPNSAVDGACLARALGIDAALAELTTAQNYLATDQLEARAMQTALWHGTLGYFLESMVPALASEEQRALVREHFLKHVRGRGAIPAVRVGKQPYGILPVSNLRNFAWATARETPARISRASFSVLVTLFRAAMVARADLGNVLDDVAHVGGEGDAHAILLRVLGLHPSSVEFDRRIAESFASLRNAFLAQGWEGIETEQLHQAYRQSGIQLLQQLGYRAPVEGPPPSFPLFDRAFLQHQEDIKKPAIDDGTLSEQRLLGACALDGGNYIEWLLQKARTDHAAIRALSGFSPGKTPQAILFDLLCHSVNLEFGEAGLRLLLKAKLIDVTEASSLRLDKEFIGIQKRSDTLESKWDILYRQQPEVAPKNTIVAHISSLLAAKSTESSVSRLSEVLAALEQLAKLPTARLERAFAEHVDLCHYRLDAWLLSFVSAQLTAMRNAQKDSEEGARGGVYLGAYGWVENLVPKTRELEPVELDEAQRAVFDPQNSGALVRDTANAGYVHAPSLPQGLTAAVLRNSYISAASADDVERYKINLSSERVRAALGIIEGIQQGQGLAELLGYQLERGLHDRTDLELDVFIYELRKVFPLGSGQLGSTAIRAGRVAKNATEATRFAEEALELKGTDAAAKVEARNVVNGLTLLERVAAAPANESYPFGFPFGTGIGQLRAASAAQIAAIDAEVERLKNVRDAVADLALAESVHQTVQGNYERAAGALDAFSKGAFPQLPDVIQSPASGLGLTHRFAVHFPAGISPDAGTSPRSKAEPALNAWLKDLFPPAASIQCSVRFRPRPEPDAAPGAWSTFPVTLAQIELEPIDLLYLHDAESAKNLNALDDHVLRVFRTGTPRRFDLELELDYLSAAPNQLSFFQLGALLSQLRSVVIAARPLEASDLALQNEGSKTRNATARVAPERIQKAKAQLAAALGPLQAQVVAPLSPLVDLKDSSVGAAHVPQILASIDAILQAFVARLAPLSRFGLEGAGSAFVGERLRGIREGLCALVRERSVRWAERSERCRAIIEDELPAAATEEQKVELWHQAETQVSTTFTGSFADATALGVAVTAKRNTFEQKRTDAAAFLTQAFTAIAPLFAGAVTLLSGTESFDLEPLNIDEAVRLVVVLAEDLLRQASQLHARASACATDVDALLLKAQTAPLGGLAELTEASQRLLGQDFKLFPELTLAAEPAQELNQCLADQAQLLGYQTGVVGTDDPTEDWLYGVARVREKLAAWESLVVLAEGFVSRPPLRLTALQLPYRTGDSWLGLAYPPEHVIQGDNLLYTAYAPAFDPTQPIVGALVDEWTETIPARDTTTALTFHYDRPNCEAPQSLLLVTPAAMTGQWQWTDLVGALHESLDLARVRALEPDLIDRTSFAKLVPATVATMTAHPVTMTLNFALQQLAQARI